MTYTLTETGARRYLPCQHPEAFTHRPSKKAGRTWVSPVAHKEFWNHMWATIKAQEWFEADVGMVMVDDAGFAYCQYPGQTTGLARVHVGIPK